MEKEKKLKNPYKIILLFLFVILINLLIFKVKFNHNIANKEVIITKLAEILPNNNILSNEFQVNSKNSKQQTILIIPKINLKKELVDKDSNENDVNKNILTIRETTFPSENDYSHVILAAHSGYGNVSYFKNLTKLEINDEIYLYYNENKYIYKITAFYEIEKTGQMMLHPVSNNDITLITCLKGQNKQIIYQGKLDYTSNYS